MSTLTKDQVRKLTAEQQEALGALEASRISREQRLLEHARHYRGRNWLPALVFAALPPLCVSLRSWEFLPLVVAMMLWLLIRFHAAGINRRLDALTELLDSSRKGDPPIDGGPTP